jgi:hypothetical protein
LKASRSSPLGTSTPSFQRAFIPSRPAAFTLVVLTFRHSTWPECWEQHTVCAAEAVYAVDELEILGIMAGQVLVGIECDWIGTSAGAAQDAAVMLLGTLLLIGAWGTSLQGWVACVYLASARTAPAG